MENSGLGGFIVTQNAHYRSVRKVITRLISAKIVQRHGSTPEFLYLLISTPRLGPGFPKKVVVAGPATGGALELVGGFSFAAT
jgi:hypothetical protein